MLRLTADARFQYWCVGMVLLLGLVIRLYAAWDWNGYHPNSPEMRSKRFRLLRLPLQEEAVALK